jgi:hypothetical protein
MVKMSVSFFNEGAYIRMVNNVNGVDVRVNKANLMIQKDSDLSFFLKNDTYISYFNYDQVAAPSASNLTDLVNRLAGWNTSFNSNFTVNMEGTSTTTFSTAMLDSLSRLKVSGAPNTTLNIITLYDKNATKIDELTAGSATSTHNAYKGTVNMTTAEVPGSKVIRQSKLYTPHLYGSQSVAVVGGVLTTNSNNSNVVSRIGVFDDAANVTLSNSQPTGNGLFFQYDNSNKLSLVYRTNATGSQVDTTVEQNAWNIDKLDGTGISTHVINVSTHQNYVLEWNMVNPSMPSRAGIYYKDGVIYCHSFSSNVNFFGNPCLPVRWEIAHDASLGAVPDITTLTQGQATVYADETSYAPKRLYSYNNGSNMTLMTSNFTVPLMSLCLAPGFNRAKLHPKQLEIINTAAGGTGIWNIILNSTLSNVAFSNVGNNSFAQYSSSETSATGGLVVASGYIYDAGVKQVDLDFRDITLMSSINGTQDVLSVTITNLLGTLNVTAGLEWIEQE